MSLPPSQPNHEARALIGMQPDNTSGGGGPNGAPFLHYSGDDGAQNDTRQPNPNFEDMTGDGVEITVGDSNGYQISTVSWSITPNNAIAQTLNYRTGYTNAPYSPPQGVPPDPISFEWSSSPGSSVITATVNYVNANIPQAVVSMGVPLVLPTGNIAVNPPLGTPTLIPGNGTSTLSSAALGSVGISFTATVNPATIPTGLDGEFSVIQTIDPFTIGILWSDGTGNHAELSCFPPTRWIRPSRPEKIYR